MSPGEPLLTRATPSPATTSVAVLGASPAHYGMPNGEGAEIFREAGLADNIVSIRDFLDRKHARK
jgi:hypothetical protein